MEYAVRYHIESYGHGRSCHSFGPVLPLRVVKAAPGPEGYLRVRLADDGKYRIDEDDVSICPAALHGAEVDSETGGQVIIDD